jgi:hypothetical protein
VRPALRLTNVGYDDNIFASSDADKVGDYTATVTGQLQGLVLFGSRAFLQFNEQIDYTAYVDNPDQNFPNQRGSGRLTVPFRRMGLFTDFAVNRYRERPQDRLDIRPRVSEDMLGIGGILQVGWRTELELGQWASEWRYTDDDPELARKLDRQERLLSLKGRYAFNDRTSLVLGLDGTDLDFVRPDDIIGNRDSRLRQVLGGVELGEGGPLGGRARLGYARSDSVNASLDELSAAIGEIELLYRLSSYTRLTITGERLPGLAVTEAQNYFLNSRYGLRGLHYLNRIFGLEAGVFQGRLTFPGSPRVDSNFYYDLGVRVRLAENTLGRRIEYGLKVGRFRRDSTEDALDLSKTTLGIDATVGF